MLGRWGQRDRLKEIDRELARRDRDVASRGRQPPEVRRWYVNGQGQTMVIIPGPVEFWMGSPRTEVGPEGGAEPPHYRRVGRTFALAAHEVTVGQFLRFRADHRYNKQYSPTADPPMNMVSWFEAAAYCNWLSKQEDIPEGQWCYVPTGGGKAGPGMRARQGFLGLSGYRLPTEAEWEYACRAGSATGRPYGETEELLGRYAWYSRNSLDQGLLLPGSLRPNDGGLFDVLGNTTEWSQNRSLRHATGGPGAPIEDEEDKGDTQEISDMDSRLLRGRRFTFQPWNVRSAFRFGYGPLLRFNFSGLRPARTVR